MKKLLKYILPVILIGFVYSVNAEILVPAQAANKVNATVSVDVTQDQSTHLYTYTYTVSNDALSEQSIDSFAIEIDESTPVVEATAPVGWSFGRHVAKNIYEFSSTEGITDEHVVTLPNGGYEIRSPYNIKPGDSLCCFVFKTFSSPTQGNAYIQGYVPTPQSTGEEYELDAASLGIASFSIEDNSFIAAVNVPKVPLYDGNRRPAIDGFVAPINFNSANKDEFYAPVTLYVAFGVNNEVVFTDTFKAILNGIDITQQFVGDVSATSSKNITLSLDASSPLQTGSNTLILSVEGVVPGSTDRNAVDTDRIVFKVLGGK